MHMQVCACEAEDNLRCYSLDGLHLFLRLKIMLNVSVSHCVYVFHVPAAGR